MSSCDIDIGDISPQSALKNVDVMHLYLQRRLKSVCDASDLIPYINVLMPLNSLKIQLSALLHQQLQLQKDCDSKNKHPNEQHSERTPNNIPNTECEKNPNRDKIRSLYISLCSLNGIPSDVLHAKIISFLPSSEYKKLPMLSRHFRNIMRSSPFIYNEKKYTVQLLLKNSSFSNQSMPSISVQHNTQNIIVRPMEQIAAHNKSTHNAISYPESKKKENKVVPFADFPLHDMNIWRIHCETADWLWVGSEYRNQSDDEQSDNGLVFTTTSYTNSSTLKTSTLPTGGSSMSVVSPTMCSSATTAATLSENNDSYNHLCIHSLLYRANNAIKKLELVNVRLSLQSKIFGKEHQFNQCVALTVKQSPTYDSILMHSNHANDACFRRLQYLCIWYPKQDKLCKNTWCAAELLKTDPANVAATLDDRQLDQFYNHIARKKVLCDAMNKILTNCASTLLAFVYHDENESEILSWGWCQTMLSHLRSSINIKGVLSIPRNVEFVSLRNSSFLTDLTACKQLIGVEILGDANYRDIRWPNPRKNGIVPYCYLSPSRCAQSLTVNHWKRLLIEYHTKDEHDMDEQYVAHVPYARFICLGKHISRATPALKFSWDPELDDLNEVVDDDVSDQLERCKINEVFLKEEKFQSAHTRHGQLGMDGGDMYEDKQTLKCLLLHRDEMNADLFHKLMMYKFPREQVRMNKIARYRKLWQLGAANWIRHIGVIDKWNGKCKKKPSYWSVTE